MPGYHIYNFRYYFYLLIQTGPMKNNQYPFWLRFAVFLIISSVALFFIIFIFDYPPAENLNLLILEAGGLAIGSYLVYKMILRVEPGETRIKK